MVNKQIVYEKPVDTMLFQKCGITSLFEAVGLDKMLTPNSRVYPILIKQFYGNMSIKSYIIETMVQNTIIYVDATLLENLFNIP